MSDRQHDETTATLPEERTLPGRDEMLQRILDDDSGMRHSARRTLRVPLVAAVAAAVVVGGSAGVATVLGDGTSALSVGDDTTSSGTPTVFTPSFETPTVEFETTGPAPETSKPGASAMIGVATAVRILHGDEAARLASRCVQQWNDGDAIATRPATVDDADVIPYAWIHTNSLNGRSRTVALVFDDAQTGDSYACWGSTARGEDPAQAAGLDMTPFAGPGAITSSEHRFDATHPVLVTDAGGLHASGPSDGSSLTFTRRQFYRADDRVAFIRQRFVIDGVAQHWYASQATGGYGFVVTSATVKAPADGTSIEIETQVLGTNGQLLDAPAEPVDGGGLADSPGTTQVQRYTLQDMGGGLFVPQQVR